MKWKGCMAFRVLGKYSERCGMFLWFSYQIKVV